MKHNGTRRLLLVLTVLLLLPALVACTGTTTGEQPTATDSREVTTNGETETDAPVAKNYAIVLAKINADTLRGLAEHIQKTLKDVAGVEATVITDDTVPSENTFEILVGSTSRAESDAVFFRTRGWSVGVGEKNAVIKGYNHYDTACAAVWFLENCLSADKVIDKESGFGYTYDGVNTMTAGEFLQYVKVSDKLTPKKLATYDLLESYTNMQGGGTDGEYFYLIFNQADDNGARIVKIDPATNKIVAERAGLQLAHANDIAYNSKTGNLVVSWCSKDSSKISYINPNTLQITATVDTNTNHFSIAYNETRDQYVVAASGGYDLKVMGASRPYTVVSTFAGINTRDTKQGIDCDDHYIYYSQTNFSKQSILTFDWEGKLVRTFEASLQGEIENVFWYNGNFYSGYNVTQNKVHERVLYTYEFNYGA